MWVNPVVSWSLLMSRSSLLAFFGANLATKRDESDHLSKKGSHLLSWTFQQKSLGSKIVFRHEKVEHHNVHHTARFSKENILITIILVT